MTIQPAEIIELPVASRPPRKRQLSAQHGPQLREFTAGLGDRARAARQAADLTLKQAGKRIGVANQSVLNWETGDRVPTKRNLRLMAEVYGVEPRWLATGDGAAPTVVAPYKPTPKTGAKAAKEAAAPAALVQAIVRAHVGSGKRVIIEGGRIILDPAPAPRRTRQ
jgi:transcriptional regulator with XRE-family HTH domain